MAEVLGSMICNVFVGGGLDAKFGGIYFRVIPAGVSPAGINRASQTGGLVDDNITESGQKQAAAVLLRPDFIRRADGAGVR